MSALSDVVRFTGWPAIIAAIAFSIPEFWRNVGSAAVGEVIVRSTTLSVAAVYIVFVAGAVILQRQNALYPARAALLSGAFFAVPVALIVLGLAAISMTPETENVVFGAIAFISCWLFLTFLAFMVIYLVPRVVPTRSFRR